MKVLFYSLVILIAVSSCSQIKDQTTEEQTKAFINPGFEGIDIPFENYTVEAEKGDTIYYKSGSILVFPPNSFIDKEGNVVEGDVKVTYREFNDPTDFFISGIPMNYDSAGAGYTFESAGMCEVNAYQNGDAVYVNPQNKPEVHLAGNESNPDFNLYYLDTVEQRWIYKGKDEITDLEDESYNDQEKPLPSPPVKPIKASGKQPVISITVIPGSLEELQAYNNLKFEIDKSETNFDPTHTEIEWQDIKLKESTVPGKYKITFINTEKTVSYMVRPVFEGKDYDEALKIFKKKNQEYKRLAAKRKENEAKIKAENERIAKMNILIEERNKELERQRLEQERLAEERRKEREEKKRIEKEKREERARKQKEEREKQIEEKRRKDNARIFNEGGIEMYSTVVRSFTIDGFGVWNSDYPAQLQNRGAIILAAKFVDKKNNPLDFKMVQVVYKGFNGINAHHNPSPDHTFEQLYVIPGAENIIWAVKNKRLYYLSSEKFNTLDITSETKEFTFKMNSSSKEITSMEEIKAMLDNL